MKTIFVLTLIFSDGYLDGSTRIGDLKSMAACEKAGPQYALQYKSYGHPASFFCTKELIKNSKGPVEVIHYKSPYPDRAD
jgi:hypothetical protein